MKKLMQLLLLCLATVPATAQTEKSQVLIYMLDGKVDTLLLNNVRDIYHSRRDANGVEQTDISTLRLRTVGSERVYPLSEIDHVVMPKSRRVVSFVGTTQPESETAGARQFTSVDGNFPGNAGDKVVYKWVAKGGNYDYIFLENGQRSKHVGWPYSDRPNGEFKFELDTLVADAYTIYYPGSNAEVYNKVKILDVQTQTAPNNSEHLGKSGDCGWAVATRQPNSDYLFQLQHEVAVLCFIPRVDSLKTIVLKDIAVKSTDGKLLAGDYTLSTDGITLDSGTGKDTIKLTLGDSRNIFHVPNNKQVPEGAEWEHTPQDSVAAYMVVAPQAESTPLKVYYHIYDTESEIDTVEVKELTATSGISKATVYPITNKLNPRLFFAAFTDSCQWDFNQPARVYGSVNLPIENHGFIWGFNKNLDFATKEGDLPSTTLSDFPEYSFNKVAVNEVKQKAYYYRAYAKEGDQTWFGKVKKFGMDREIINMGTSVRWSSINMGAITAEDPGNQYAWGEKTTNKPAYSAETYKYYKDSKYEDIGTNIAGNPEYDVVTATWRGCWRMPTKAEMHELVTKCGWTWADSLDEDGINHHGLLVKNTNNNPDSVIFLPADGYRNGSAHNDVNNCYYQTGTIHPTDSRWNLYQKNNNTDNSAWRYEGLSIRPVFESNIETTDGKYLFIRTDSISYSADHTSTIMYGTTRGMDDVVTNLTQGFVIGTAEDVTLESGDALKVTLTQSAGDNGSYNLPLTREEMNELAPTTTYHVRAYLTYGDNTWYGEPLPMLAMTIATDSTDWEVGKESIRLCGSVTGITDAVKNDTEIGFVVGETEDVTIVTADSVIVCDSTVNNKFVCEYDSIEFKQYYYRAYVNVGGRIAYGDPKLFGLEFIDLGLPSGLKWANINVGSQTPMDNGGFFSWGETRPKSNYGQSYYSSGGATLSDIGGTIYDAAQVNWQGPWRMPSKADVQELLANVTQQPTKLYGKDGFLLTSKINGKTIFFPKTGYKSGTGHPDSDWRVITWTSTKFSDSGDRTAWYYDNYNDRSKIQLINNDWLRDGMTVRPVALVNKTLDDESMIQLTTDSVHWEVGDKTATLYGYLLGLRYNSKAQESGFAYATTPNVSETTPGVKYLKTNEGETQHVSSGKFQSVVPSIKDSTVYYFRAYVRVDGKYYFAEEREFGRRMVELIPNSGVYWSNINLGATSIDDSGDYYAWGETAPKSEYSSATYTKADYGTDISGSSHDAAHVNWGGLWRMPTVDDVNDLVSQCTWTEVTKYGQPMYKVVGPSGDSIFIAKRGSISGTSLSNNGSWASFWTSNLNVTDDYERNNAYGTSFYGTNRTIDAVARYLGYTVRPIIKYNKQYENTKFYLTTDSTDWYVGNDNPRLVGAVAGLDALDADPNVTVTRGFVVGYTSADEALRLNGTNQEVENVVATKSATDDSFRGNITYAKDTTYYYRAYVKIGEQYYYGNIRRYGLELVDMGNGVMWASINLGAQTSSDFGDRYAWGEIVTKNTYTQSTYRWYDQGYLSIGSDISNKPTYDAVKANWTGDKGWRMPTNAEMRVLVDSCDWAWTTVDGVGGYQVTSRKENDRGTHNSIFLPAAGYQNSTFYSELGSSCYYWTASQLYDHQAYCLYGTETTPRTADGGFDRYYGLCVRPVTKSGVIEGGGGDITGGHNPGGSSQTGGTGGNGGGNAGKGNTGGTIGN